MDRWAQMFITPEEFDRLIGRLSLDLGLTSASDDAYVYVTYGQDVRPEAVGRGIRLQRPRIEGDTLYLVQHDVRTDDPELIRLFDRMRRRWGGFLGRPVRGRNLVRGGTSSYRTLGFTAGALALHRAGFRWKEKAAPNVEFDPDESAEPPPALPA